jgi:hypothetical protein
LRVMVSSMWGALSDERTGLSFVICPWKVSYQYVRNSVFTFYMLLPVITVCLYAQYT